MATTRDAEAVFHDRKAVEEAVRALELEGIRRNRIRVQRANTLGGVVRRPPERGGIMVAGAGMGAVVGVGIGLLAMLGTGVLPPAAVTVRLITTAVSGGLIGALVALLVSGLRHESRYGAAAGYRDFVVRVKAKDEASAAKLRDLLERAGGEPLPA